jgi:hypothetical protein
MPGRNLEILVATIMNTPPYQLPPVVHASGCYTLDISYRGHSLNKVGFSIEECLESYLNHVTKYYHLSPRQGSDPLQDLPVKLGAKIEKR